MKENDILQAQDVRFRYDTEQPNFAVDGVSMEVHRGEFVAVLGANGCGKSTLAKHFNAILLPESGTVLKLAGIYEQRNKAPHKLSGGQKQRVAIAGVIAMRPDCLILDESTAMLDPRGRAQVMKTIRNLRDAGISIVSITHYMEEAAQADRILVMSRGRIVMEGTPKQVFSQTKRLHGYHLDVPQATELRDELAAAGLPMPENIITPEECAKAIFDLLK